MCIDMANDDRDEVIQARAQRLKAYREAAGFRFRSEAARANGWSESTYRSHENGTRPIGDDDAENWGLYTLHHRVQDVLLFDWIY